MHSRPPLMVRMVCPKPAPVVMAEWHVIEPAPVCVIQNQMAVAQAILGSRATRSGSKRRTSRSPKIDCEILVWLRSPRARTGPYMGWLFSTDEVDRNAPSSSAADALPAKLASCSVLELPQTNGESHDVVQEDVPALTFLASQLGAGAP